MKFSELLKHDRLASKLDHPHHPNQHYYQFAAVVDIVIDRGYVVIHSNNYSLSGPNDEYHSLDADIKEAYPNAAFIIRPEENFQTLKIELKEIEL